MFNTFKWKMYDFFIGFWFFSLLFLIMNDNLAVCEEKYRVKWNYPPFLSSRIKIILIIILSFLSCFKAYIVYRLSFIGNRFLFILNYWHHFKQYNNFFILFNNLNNQTQKKKIKQEDTYDDSPYWWKGHRIFDLKRWI